MRHIHLIFAILSWFALSGLGFVALSLLQYGAWQQTLVIFASTIILMPTVGHYSDWVFFGEEPSKPSTARA